jgi:nitrate reductase gamma subunit
MAILDNFLLIGLPYIAFVVFLVGTIYRFKATKFTYSSLSSQLLEGNSLFWGSVPFHWGILFLFFGHMVAFLFPKSVLVFTSLPLRLLIIEISAFMFGLVVLFSLIALFVRRVSNSRIKPVTSTMDIIIELLLLTQVVLGLLVALIARWGSPWFAAVLTPYLRSLFTLTPDIGAVASMSWLIKSHLIGAFLICALLPFSRLVHILIVPLPYLWRPYQRVVWTWPRSKVRDPNTKWTLTRPKNN